MVEIARVDVRGLPAWERPRIVYDAFDQLANGEHLTIITDNEPRGLTAHLEENRKHQFMIETKRVGDREWHLVLRRTAAEAEFPSPEAILRRSAAFGGLADGTRQTLARAATMHTMRRTQTIVPENFDWPYVGIAFEGVLALSSGSGVARERIFYEIFPYEVFGETEFFDRAMTLGRIIVLSKAARYLRIPRDVVLATGLECPQLIIELAHVGAQRTRLLADALTAQATQPILARIASVLLPYSLPDRGLSAAMSPLPNMTQAQIAAAAGTVKEVAARAIAELEIRELLKRERGHIRYLNRQGLLDLVRELS
ncbi:MAG TPA: DUF2249 domain-containing protein [Candidatus Baltobacteraceae bacterium]|jgi:uncharacterized protein (DUF2249 family)/CRP-like cAMP-binding protein|nr:DUF2249 domain-containing protein [Candidatus Baltobacteraceae bacterium]